MTEETRGIKPGLSQKRARFVEEYLVDGNGTQAAIRAGYAPRAANEQAARLLANASVMAAVAHGRKELFGGLRISAERVLLERARLAFFDARKLLDATGRPKAIHELDDDTAAAIAGIDVVNIGNEEKGIGEVLKLRMADKNASLTALEKHLGLYKDDRGDSEPLHIHIHL